VEYNISDKGELGYVIKLVGAAFHKRPKHYFEGISKRRFINRAKFFIHPRLNNTTPFSCN